MKHIGKQKSSGFTIVELLVVVIVMAILAAITIVAYVGMGRKASEATLQSDLSAASKQLKLYSIEHSAFPASLDGNYCPTSPTDTQYCLKPTSGNTFSYSSSSPYSSFTLDATNTASSITYRVTNNANPQLVVADPNWLAIGTQTWAKYNLNDGIMIAGASEQTNNSVVEKYCYNDSEANCTANGGLYQWDEVMQYATSEGAQGLCPTGSHIPTDSEWKTLEIFLGLTQVQADATGWRGTNQGTQLKAGGSSGMNIPVGGLRTSAGGFNAVGTSFNWSSTQVSTNAWMRQLNSTNATVARYQSAKVGGVSVRCLKN